MKKQLVLISVIVGVSGLTIYFFNLTSPSPDVVVGDYVVERTIDGYDPETVVVQVGDTVTWINNHDEYHWPASDTHPTHSDYPDFDPRSPIAPGESWSFTFTQTGEWAYHDHLRANVTGIINVVE